ncbi:Kiwa anti-phage protein KwaB-like domain-containing protein [Parasphingopyxis marina]|uniref:DUF4868 domain-containing protein n=1 Tax=Parasphingopyxis marina TaxID=2761622 RepID=A0A842HRQ8_9SPHN|nr:Kiwa anti-phage protein KwaB-like domain-containing protein [Parasphingopyxis marina]MBC2776498.1 DUF4868 domain-containing protein [Parasphingopyxis marina]
MGNLYGLIGPRGIAEVRLMQVDGAVQQSLNDLFPIYEEQFLEGIEETVGFDGGYNPDQHQIVDMPMIEEMGDVVQQIAQGAIGRDPFRPNETPIEDIRALVWCPEEVANERYLVQNFTRAQALTRKAPLFFNGETFSKLEEPSLLIAPKIDAIMQRGHVQFKKFNVLKQVFNLFEIYREATDADIIAFADNHPVDLGNLEDFCENANQTARKLIFSISRAGVIAERPAQDVQELAAQMELEIQVERGRIVLPEGRDLITVLKFLDNGIYRSPITNDRWMANSRRRL